MLEPIFDAPDREEWDEHDWERFLRQSDTRAAKYQELYETLEHHPRRDELIAREMGWAEALKKCGGAERDCTDCDQRFECEAYAMLRLMSEPESIEDDPDADELIASFEQVRRIPAYCRAQEFADKLEDILRERAPRWAADEDVRNTLLAAQMVSAQIAGGHGIGYERDSLCGNIANCKRALRSLATSLDHLWELESRGVLGNSDTRRLHTGAGLVATEINRWIENLRARIWWR